MMPAGLADGDVAFSWNGMPQYAAREIRAAINHLGVACDVVGSKPSVPVTGMEQSLGQKIHWVDAHRSISWTALGLNIPKIFVQSGWSYPAFSALGREVKKSGGKVIGLSDANWRGDFRQKILGYVGYRQKYLRHFDIMIVPGKQSRKLMRYFGMQDAQIIEGMCGADPNIFNGGAGLANRPKSILFVGQFISRKNVLSLCATFSRFCEMHGDWNLRLCGSGEQRQLLPQHPNIKIEDFVQPENLAEHYRNARFFILPSHIEAWGLVVHEAALCGCAMLLSTTIGSADDLADKSNSFLFDSKNEDTLYQALCNAAKCDADWLIQAEQTSRNLALKFGPSQFGNAIVTAIVKLQDARAASGPRKIVAHV